MKQRRDITLGEMQDECGFRGDNCETIGGDKCKFFELCATMQTIDKGCLTPIMWNLTDPPRFNEAQMALLRWWNERGAVKAGLSWDNQHGDVIVFLDIKGSQTGNMQESSMTIIFKTESYFIATNPLDLAELLGKDAT